MSTQLSLWEEEQKQCPVAPETSRKVHRRQITNTDSVILKEKALIIWLNIGQRVIPLQRTDALYTIVTTGVPRDRKAVAEVSGHYELLELTDQEIAYLSEYAYRQLIEQRGTMEEQSVPVRLTTHEEEVDQTEEGHSQSKPRKKPV